MNEAIKDLDKVELDEQQKQKIVDSYHSKTEVKNVVDIGLIFQSEGSNEEALKVKKLLSNFDDLFKSSTISKFIDGHLLTLETKASLPVNYYKGFITGLMDKGYKIDDWFWSSDHF